MDKEEKHIESEYSALHPDGRVSTYILINIALLLWQLIGFYYAITYSYKVGMWFEILVLANCAILPIALTFYFFKSKKKRIKALLLMPTNWLIPAIIIVMFWALTHWTGLIF